MLRGRLFFVGLLTSLFFVMFIFGGACSPQGGTGQHPDEKSDGQGGGERSSLEQNNKEKPVDNIVVDKLVTDGSPQESLMENTPDDTTADVSSEMIADNAGHTESISEPVVEQPQDAGHTDIIVKESIVETKVPLCVSSHGVCTPAQKACKIGLVPVSNPMGCQRGDICCLPQSGKCGKEGETISLMEHCCKGLTRGAVAKPPGCMTIGQKFVCVKCGDGKCDASKGENACSCPKDCKTAKNACELAKGRCVNSRMMCRPTEKTDRTLSCGSKILVCCVPSVKKCQTDKDCPKRTCSGLSSCHETFYKCNKSGICQQFITPTIKKSRCDFASGRCKSYTGCKSHCDCKQGESCAITIVGGKCVMGKKPKYCCDNAGCPAKMACTYRNGKSGTCPATTPCTKNKGVCVGQFNSCPRNYTRNTKYSCNAKALYCCMPATNQCQTNSDCPPAKCSTGTLPNSCYETYYTCIAGRCMVSSKNRTNATCSANGRCATITDCTKQKGYCATQGQKCKAGYAIGNASCGPSLALRCCLPKTSKCQTNADCASPKCHQTFTTCVQTISKCISGVCSAKTTKMKGKCNSKGYCSPIIP